MLIVTGPAPPEGRALVEGEGRVQCQEHIAAAQVPLAYQRLRILGRAAVGVRPFDEDRTPDGDEGVFGRRATVAEGQGAPQRVDVECLQARLQLVGQDWAGLEKVFGDRLEVVFVCGVGPR